MTILSSRDPAFVNTLMRLSLSERLSISETTTGLWQQQPTSSAPQDTDSPAIGSVENPKLLTLPLPALVVLTTGVLVPVPSLVQS